MMIKQTEDKAIEYGAYLDSLFGRGAWLDLMNGQPLLVASTVHANIHKQQQDVLAEYGYISQVEPFKKPSLWQFIRYHFCITNGIEPSSDYTIYSKLGDK